MHDNRIYYIPREDAEKRISELKQRQDVFTVVLEGSKIKNWNDYIRVITKEFRFPTFEARNFAGYRDYLTDLMWIDKNAFALFILDYDDFMADDNTMKKAIMNWLLTDTLFWWGEDVEIHCMGGESKEFNIYLVNGYKKGSILP